MKKKESSLDSPKPCLLIIFGNQLFLPKFFPQEKNLHLYLAEDEGLCTHFRYHQQKIVLFLSAMRHYASERKEEGYQAYYHLLKEKGGNKSYEQKLEKHLIAGA